MSAKLSKSEGGALKEISFCTFSLFLKVFMLSVVLNARMINSMHPSTEKRKNFTMKERMG